MEKRIKIKDGRLGMTHFSFTPFVFSQHKNQSAGGVQAAGREHGSAPGGGGEIKIPTFVVPSRSAVRLYLCRKLRKNDYGSITTTEALHSFSQLLQRLRVFPAEMEIRIQRLELL